MICHNGVVVIVPRIRQGTKMYQSIFNETLTKLRLVVSATGNQNLMRAVAKIMFDFSDSLKEHNLLKDKEQENGMDKNTNNFNN